eukprot:g4229.t1
MPARAVVNATSVVTQKATTVESCSALCLSVPSCVAFTWQGATGNCEGFGLGGAFAAAAAAAETVTYYRVRTLDRSPVHAAARFALDVPTGGVALSPSSLLGRAFAANVRYLKQFPVDDMLFWFRRRAGLPTGGGASWGWDDAPFESGNGLKGSVAGAFLMGAGGTLRWDPGAAGGLLRQRLLAVVRGIKECRDAASGYIMAFPANESTFTENPDYVSAWLTHGLLEAAVGAAAVPGGNGTRDDALGLLRTHFDWFNSGAQSRLAEFLPPAPQGAPFVTDRRDPQFLSGHKIYLIYQGIIHHTRLALSAVGQRQDVRVAEDLYAEPWWLEQLAGRNVSAVWLRSKSPHNYEITALEAYMDLFEITADVRYIDAVDGFYDMFHRHWLHVGGTVAIKENKLYPPGSYYLDSTGPTSDDAHWGSGRNCSLDPKVPDRICPPGANRTQCEGCTHSTGETCGQVFWVKLSQRLHRFRPRNETYPAEVERVIVNGVISQIPMSRGLGVNGTNGIRQFALLHKRKMTPSNISTCCEGQATRLLGSLPEHLASFDMAARAVSLDMYQAANVSLARLFPALRGAAGAGAAPLLRIATAWPTAAGVTVDVLLGGGAGGGGARGFNFSVDLRVPRWLGAARMAVTLTPAQGPLGGLTAARGAVVASGRPGSYMRVAPPRPAGWRPRDRLSFSLPMRLRASRYTGRTAVAGHERYAVEYGPVLLALVGAPWNATIDSMLVRGVTRPGDPDSWLVPDPSVPLHFRLRLAGGVRAGLSELLWKPYYEVQDELFEVFPAFA